MNTKALVAATAARLGLPQNQVEPMVKVLIDVMKTELVNGGTVTLTDFGQLAPQTRSARNGRNPMTGEVLALPELKTIKFKVSLNVKRELNK